MLLLIKLNDNLYENPAMRSIAPGSSASEQRAFPPPTLIRCFSPIGIQLTNKKYLKLKGYKTGNLLILPPKSPSVIVFFS